MQDAETFCKHLRVWKSAIKFSLFSFSSFSPKLLLFDSSSEFDYPWTTRFNRLRNAPSLFTQGFWSRYISSSNFIHISWSFDNSVFFVLLCFSCQFEVAKSVLICDTPSEAKRWRWGWLPRNDKSSMIYIEIPRRWRICFSSNQQKRETQAQLTSNYSTFMVERRYGWNPLSYSYIGSLYKINQGSLGIITRQPQAKEGNEIKRNEMYNL